MKVKNLTADMQKVEVKELTDRREIYTVYLMPYSEAEFEKAVVLHLDKLKGVVEPVGTKSVVTPVRTEEIVAPEIVETPQEVLEDVIEEVVDEEEISEDVVESTEISEEFICDLCGAEFASLRGLNSHKKKSHN